MTHSERELHVGRRGLTQARQELDQRRTRSNREETVLDIARRRAKAERDGPSTPEPEQL